MLILRGVNMLCAWTAISLKRILVHSFKTAILSEWLQLFAEAGETNLTSAQIIQILLIQ